MPPERLRCRSFSLPASRHYNAFSPPPACLREVFCIARFLLLLASLSEDRRPSLPAPMRPCTIPCALLGCFLLRISLLRKVRFRPAHQFEWPVRCFQRVRCLSPTRTIFLILPRF